MRQDIKQYRLQSLPQDSYSNWRHHQVTKLFFLELEELYLETLLEEPVRKSYIERVGAEMTLSHTDPVSESAINSALRSGKLSVLEGLLDYRPVDMEIDDA